MKIVHVGEFGYEQALYGIGLNKKLTSEWDKWEDVSDEVKDKITSVPDKLCDWDGGHNSFLEMIYTWWTIELPFEVWKQMDRYRLKSQTSESTMHKLMDFPITKENFAIDVPEAWIEFLEDLRVNGDFERCSKLLPQCYLQKRLVCMNYKCLRNIIIQRTGHKLPEWGVIIDTIKSSVEHPELLNYNMKGFGSLGLKGK